MLEPVLILALVIFAGVVAITVGLSRTGNNRELRPHKRKG